MVSPPESEKASRIFTFFPVRFFYDEVFRDRLAPAGIAFHVIGRGGEEPLADVFSDTRVVRHGFVDDLYELLGGMAVMVNPMIQGGGMKNKVLEAFASGIPVVSTTLGLDGIDAQAGVHCQAADSPEGLADAVFALLEDEALARRQARSARQLVEEQYTWTGSAARLKAVIGDLAVASGAATGPGPLAAHRAAEGAVTRETSG